MRSVPHLNEVHCQGELQPFLVTRGYFDREFESMVGKSASSRDAVFAILREFSRVSASFASFFASFQTFFNFSWSNVKRLNIAFLLSRPKGDPHCFFVKLLPGRDLASDIMRRSVAWLQSF